MTEEKQLEKLAKKAIRGDAQAYGALIEHYKTYLYRTAWLYLKNEEMALDAVGDCILNGFRSIHTLKNPAYFRTWLTRILINAAADHYQKNPVTEDVTELSVAAPEDSLSQEEKWDLHRAIDRLPEKYRTVVILKYFDELKISEIAYTMEIPEGSVKAYLNRARAELRHLLKEEYLYEDGISECTGIRKIGQRCGGQYETRIRRSQA
ncbi:MAG: sigma-70 family RNA polymerase sigma factor [Eubacteriales bacterium]|nr:sigma-70 family RNA polymerase sigma factor [Eubacteriales bacterium]